MLKRSSNENHAALFAIAEGQGGFFTAKRRWRAGIDRTHHGYHAHAGNWQRKHRGIYRLTQFQIPERPDLILRTLWSRVRVHKPQGSCSHLTALSLYALFDLMPAELNLTVADQVPDGWWKSRSFWRGGTTIFRQIKWRSTNATASRDRFALLPLSATTFPKREASTTAKSCPRFFFLPGNVSGPHE